MCRAVPWMQFVKVGGQKCSKVRQNCTAMKSRTLEWIPKIKKNKFGFLYFAYTSVTFALVEGLFTLDDQRNEENTVGGQQREDNTATVELVANLEVLKLKIVVFNWNCPNLHKNPIPGPNRWCNHGGGSGSNCSGLHCKCRAAIW